MADLTLTVRPPSLHLFAGVCDRNGARQIPRVTRRVVYLPEDRSDAVASHDSSALLAHCLLMGSFVLGALVQPANLPRTPRLVFLLARRQASKGAAVLEKDSLRLVKVVSRPRDSPGHEIGDQHVAASHAKPAYSSSRAFPHLLVGVSRPQHRRSEVTNCDGRTAPNLPAGGK